MEPIKIFHSAADMAPRDRTQIHPRCPRRGHVRRSRIAVTAAPRGDRKEAGLRAGVLAFRCRAGTCNGGGARLIWPVLACSSRRRIGKSPLALWRQSVQSVLCRCSVIRVGASKERGRKGLVHLRPKRRDAGKLMYFCGTVETDQSAYSIQTRASIVSLGS